MEERTLVDKTAITINIYPTENTQTVPVPHADVFGVTLPEGRRRTYL